MCVGWGLFELFFFHGKKSELNCGLWSLVHREQTPSSLTERCQLFLCDIKRPHFFTFLLHRLTDRGVCGFSPSLVFIYACTLFISHAYKMTVSLHLWLALVNVLEPLKIKAKWNMRKTQHCFQLCKHLYKRLLSSTDEQEHDKPVQNGMN